MAYVPPHKRGHDPSESEAPVVPKVSFAKMPRDKEVKFNPPTPTPTTPTFFQSRTYNRTGRDPINDKGYHGTYFRGGIMERDLFHPPESPAEPINFEKYDDIPIEVSGTDPPEGIEDFDPELLSPELLKNLNMLHYTKPTPIQKFSIPVAMKHRDLMGCAQTGSGKTAGYLCPVISLMLKEGPMRFDAYDMTVNPTALILVPTRELAEQIHQEAEKFCFGTGILPSVVYGGTSFREQDRNIQKGSDLLVATPGRLSEFIKRGKISMKGVKYLVMDEADRMLDMGFIPQVREIVSQTDMPPSHQTMMFSATFPFEIQRLAFEFLKDYIFLTVGRVGAAALEIKQDIFYVDEHEKYDFLIEKLNSISEGSILIFVDTRRQADVLTDSLYRYQYKVQCIHGDKTQEERTAALKDFKKGRVQILVATDVAARGLDIPSVNYVVNYDLPSNIDAYVHRIGRTGRAGRKGTSIAFYNHSNANISQDLIVTLEEAQQEIPEFLTNRGRRYGSGGGGGGGGGGRNRGRGRSGGYHDHRNNRDDRGYDRGYDNRGSHDQNYNRNDHY